TRIRFCFDCLSFGGGRRSRYSFLRARRARAAPENPSEKLCSESLPSARGLSERRGRTFPASPDSRRAFLLHHVSSESLPSACSFRKPCRTLQEQPAAVGERSHHVNVTRRKILLSFAFFLCPPLPSSRCLTKRWSG